MMQVGDQPLIEHGQHITEPLTVPGQLAYFPAGLDLDPYRSLLDGPQHQREPVAGLLGTLAAAIHEVSLPYWPGLARFSEVLLNRDTGVAYHRDLTAPVRCLNVVFSLANTDGYLVLLDLDVVLAFEAGWAAIFDAQTLLHGVTEPAGCRCSAVFYSPL